MPGSTPFTTHGDEILFFLHVPKAAGTAFYAALKERFLWQQVSPWDDAYLEHAYKANRPLETGQFKLMRGHVDTSISKIIPAKIRFLTMLRHPVERVISHYQYLNRVPQPGHEAVQGMSLDEFLDYPGGNYLARNYTLRMIAGATYGSKLGSYSDAELLERAKKNLEDFAFFGIAESFNESIRLLDYQMGWSPSSVPDVRNAAPAQRGRFRESTLQRIFDVNRAGIEFHQWAVERFWQTYREALASFGEAHASFEKSYLSERFLNELARARALFSLNVDRMASNKPVETPAPIPGANRASSPLVSIITPTYNHEAFIGECLRSVIDQTYSNWEMLVVDDGSTDATASIVRSFKDPRIKLLQQENKGVKRLRETYNVALEAAKGELIAVLEGDDFWPEDKLEVQVADFDNENVVLSSGITAISRNGEIEGQTPAAVPEAQFGLNRPIGRAALFLMQPDNLTFTFPVSTVLCAAALRRIGGFQQPDYLPLVDYPTFLRMTLEGEFRFHERVLGYWRRHGSSVTQGNLSSILENAYRYAFEFIGEHRSDLPISDEELDALEASWDELACMRCILRGRLLAREGQWGLARSSFAEALRYRHSPRTAAIVAAAKALCALHMPVEPIYRKMSGVDLDRAITLSTGDRTVAISDMERPRVVGRWRASCKMPAP